MKRHMVFMLGLLVVVIVNALAFAQKTPKSQAFFDIKSANKQYDGLKKKLPLENGIVALNAGVDKLETLNNQAKECVDYAAKQLSVIEDLFKTTKFDEAAPVQRADHEYLKDKKTHYTDELSQCRFFLYRSQELLIDYRDKVQQLSTYKILQRNTPVWKIDFVSGFTALSHIDVEKIWDKSGLDDMSTNQYMIGAVLLVVGLLFGIYMRMLSSYWYSASMDMHVSLRAVFPVLKATVIPLVFFAVLSSYLNTIFDSEPVTPVAELISHTILIFFVAYTVSRYLLYPSASVSNLLKLPVWFGKRLHRLFVLILTVLLMSYVIVTLADGQALSSDAFELARVAFVTMLGVLTLGFCLSFFSHREEGVKPSHKATFAKMGLWVLFFLCVLSEWFGYHRLVVYVISGILFSVLSTLLTVGVWRLIDATYECFDDKRYRLARKMHVTFGVKFNKHIFEFAIIRFSLYAILLFYYLIVVMEIWQVSENIIDNLSSAIFEGFNIVNFHIIPARLIFALLTFAVLFLLGRFIAALVAKKADFQGEEDTQIAVSTIIIYISFAISLLFSLIVTGVNFTGLAIIAGALSVGIGLGLQNIVNNFVSGLILLLEKPIKPGDRIVIDNTEGFVKRIRIRSTQISTMLKEDVIVPNAELVTNKVTNYMFRDKFWRIACKVGVAYGSDIELVRRVLMQVAYASDDVVHEGLNEPIVLFKEFSDSCLNFELWCVIYDVNKKYLVISELNFAIDAAFRKNNITIAFPQRDLHIKDYKVIAKQEDAAAAEETKE